MSLPYKPFDWSTISSDYVFDIDEDWHEKYSVKSESFSWDTMPSSGSITIELEALKVPDAVGKLLGYSYVDVNEGGVYELVRVLPVRHPVFPFMYAKTLSVQYDGQNPGVRIADSYLRDSVLFIPDQGVKKFGVYDRATITVTFWKPPYIIRTDFDPEVIINGEFTRYVSPYQFSPQQEVLTIEGTLSTLVWTEGPKGAGSPTLSDNQVKGNIPIYVNKSGVRFRWHGVPYEWIFNNDGFPEKLVEPIGQVNSTPFFGFPAQTLRYEPPAISELKYFPVMDQLGLALPYVDIDFSLQFFDPKREGLAYGDYRGHQLLPSNEPDENRNIWFGVKYLDRNGASLAGSDKLLREYDFNLLSDHWSVT